MDRGKFIHKLYDNLGNCYGTTTDIYLLPVGTKFHVINGAWDGEVIEENGKKMIWIERDKKVELKEDIDYRIGIEIEK